MSRFASVLAIALLLTVVPEDARAQRGGNFGIGGQLGDPTGLTLKAGVGRGAIDFAAGWDLSDDAFFAQGHYLLAERPLSGTELGFFWGPGLFVGSHNDNTAFGLSLNAGINYYTGPIELFGQITPRLRLVDDTDFDLGAALGLRFYP
jgi:hypothetical protein